MSLETLLIEAQARGFLGPAPVSGHLEHARDLSTALGSFDGRFLDLGSGAGVPGLVLATLVPTAVGVLLDAQRKRCDFLQDAIASLGLDGRCSVVCGRAEELARDPGLRETFDLVVARAFGAPATTAECAVGFLSPGGKLAVSEPPGDTAVPGRWPETGLRELGLSAPQMLRCGAAGVAIMELGGPTSDRWPRRTGIPAKRPLWT